MRGVPPSLGEPCFDKLEAKLAHAMLSLPATKGFDIGSGFAGTRMRGSQHNDAFVPHRGDDGARTDQPGDSESVGGAVGDSRGGESGGHDSRGGESGGGDGSAPPPTKRRRAGPASVRPEFRTDLLRTASNHAGGTLGGISNGAEIRFRVAIKPVSTIGQAQETATFEGEPVTLRARGRHDPCVLPRAVALVEGMAALVVADAALAQRARRPESLAPFQAAAAGAAPPP